MMIRRCRWLSSLNRRAMTPPQARSRYTSTLHRTPGGGLQSPGVGRTGGYHAVVVKINVEDTGDRHNPRRRIGRLVMLLAVVCVAGGVALLAIPLVNAASHP